MARWAEELEGTGAGSVLAFEGTHRVEVGAVWDRLEVLTRCPPTATHAVTGNPTVPPFPAQMRMAIFGE